MRKIINFIMATVDGYYSGPNGEFDFWPAVGDDFDEFGIQQLDEMDTLVFGRVTYEIMAAHWPTPAAKDDDPRVTTRMNNLDKIVVSRTLDKADWANTRLIKDDPITELAKLKQCPGKNIAILGSSTLTVSLASAGLIDELRVMLQPIVLGAGKSIYHTEGPGFGVKLLKTRTFDSGNVLLTYQPVA